MSARGQSTPYLPAGLPLPYYARPDLAYLEGQYFTNVTPGFIWSIQPPEGALERVLYGIFALQTSAVVSNRTPFVRYLDNTGAAIWAVPATVTVAASSLVSVNVMTGVGSSFATGSTLVIVIPDTIIIPNAKLQFNVLNMDAGDQLTIVNYQRHVIPTGPEPDRGFTPAAPTFPS